MKKIITQNSNASKRFYSVKQAAQMLQVSTNTLYKYLNDGEIGYKRIGKGRIKIPSRELLPYLSFQNIDGVENITNDYKQTAVFPIPSDTISIDKKVGLPINNLLISKLNGDIVFFRLFKVSFIIGLGLVYIFVNRLNYFNIETISPKLVFFAKTLPFALILSGIINLIGFIKYPFSGWWNTPTHIFQAVVIGVLATLSAITKNYGLFVFLSAYLGVLIDHIVRGIKTGDAENTFVKGMLKFLLILAIVGGAVSMLGLGEHFEIYPKAFVIIYQGGVYPILLVFAVAFLIYLLNSNLKKNRIAYLLLTVPSFFLMITGSTIAKYYHFDVSFLSFLTGIYTFFLCVWQYFDIEIEYKRAGYIFPAFLWVGLSIILGNYAIKSYQDRQIIETKTHLDRVSQKIVSKLDDIFSHHLPVLKDFAASEETKTAIVSNDRAAVEEIVKTIYERSEDANRIAIYNDRGIAVSVYPRNSMIEGTNFSSREYFSETKRLYKGVISSVFKGVTDEEVVVQTEPIFLDNLFIGMIGLAHSTKDIYISLEDFIDPNYYFYALDEGGVIIFSSIGYEETENSAKIIQTSDESLFVEKRIADPEWNVYVASSRDVLFDETTSIQAVVLIIIAANAMLSIVLSFVASLNTGKAGFKRKQDFLKEGGARGGAVGVV